MPGMPNGGNPFRRRPTTQQDHVSTETNPQIDTEVPNADPEVGTVDQKSSSTVVKRVRIQTPPPLSPDTPISAAEENLANRLSGTSRTGSPPPRVVADGSLDARGNPFDKDEAEALSPTGEVEKNTAKNSELSTVVPSQTGTIANPFRRTLATLESVPDASTGDERETKSQDPSIEADTQGSKSSLDVASFTRMLMTGEPSSSNAASSTTEPNARSDKSSSSKPESTSRQSSTTNMDQESSASSSDDESSEEDESDENEVKQTKRPKPALPKHRHGKSVTHTGPQTVSFSDFSASEPSSTPTRPPRPLSKELPPLPRVPSSSSRSPEPIPSSETQRPTSTQRTRSDSAQSSSSTKPARGGPPPVPLARRSTTRQEQRQKSSSQQPDDALDQPEQASQARSEPPVSVVKDTKAPPPPPSRRTTIKASAVSDQSSTSEASSAMEPFTEMPSSTETSSGKRSPNTVQGSSRSSSISERPQGPSAPPPPPPPRRRGSSKSSMDMPRQASGSPADRNRRPSHEGSRRISGLNQVTIAEDETKRNSSGDVLANLDALQAEVDALRNSFRNIS